MILDGIFAVLFGFLEIVFGLFDVWDAPTLTGLAEPSNPENCPVGFLCSAGNVMSDFGNWIDVGALVTVVNFLLPIAALAVITKIAIWVYERFPGKAA